MQAIRRSGHSAFSPNAFSFQDPHAMSRLRLLCGLALCAWSADSNTSARILGIEGEKTQPVALLHGLEHCAFTRRLRRTQHSPSPHQGHLFAGVHSCQLASMQSLCKTEELATTSQKREGYEQRQAERGWLRTSTGGALDRSSLCPLPQGSMPSSFGGSDWIVGDFARWGLFSGITAFTALMTECPIRQQHVHSRQQDKILQWTGEIS